MSRVLFVCVQNAGRSQMAEALFTAAADGHHEARSAGTAPAAHVHPEVVQVMREFDLDLSERVSRTGSSRLMLNGRMWSLRWAAAMPAPPSRASATWTGS